ncbi:general negative regulator of transcription subunit 5 [Sorochytrium milnesiophthora]
MAGRKLQNEIDRALKKVTEGVEGFEGILEKLNSTTNGAQREKYEQELKKEIKKLQRTRDQIKTWLGLSEIKDKRALLDNRKLIETQMERFKAIEKELKTKAFSKEGLGLPNKVDPEQARREAAVDWINEVVEKIMVQVDAMEAQQEQLQIGAKRTKKGAIGSAAEQMDTLTRLIERHRRHARKLELILRALENEMIGPDEVEIIRENVEYYIDSYQDVEADNLDIYDDIGIDEEMLLTNVDVATAGVPAHIDPLKDKKLERVPEDKDEDTTPAATPTPRAKAAQPTSALSSPTKPAKAAVATVAVTTPAAAAAAAVVTPTTAAVPAAAAAKTPDTRGTSQSRAAAEPAAAPQPVAMPAPAPPIVLPTPPAGRYAAIAASAVHKDEKKGKAVDEKARVVAEQDTEQEIRPTTATAAVPSAVAIQPAVAPTTPKTSLAKVVAQGKDATRLAKERSPSAHSAISDSLAPSETGNARVPEPASTEEPQQQDTAQPATAAVETTNASAPNEAAPATENLDNRLPSSLADLVEVFQNAKNRAFGAAVDDGSHIQSILDSTAMYAPDTTDAERLKHYTPQNPYAAPAYYHQQPPSIFENPLLYERLDTETLFFIFYYQQGTYPQYLAARELKRQSWRFHKKYLTWFQRHEEPKSITDEYEQGTYIYFDYEGAWCQRKKTDFRFEYKFLEDAEML